MSDLSYKYVIVGAGVAGAAAVEGVRELDPLGSIVLIGAERDVPYNRPPLSKQLWTGGKSVEQIFVHDREFYSHHSVDLRLETEVTQINPSAHVLRDNHGNSWRYERLLLATGGTPRYMDIPGGRTEGIFYFRTLDDYRDLRAEALEDKTALVIGGGFIGSEMAAALRMNKLQVMMLFPGNYLVPRVFPESLGTFLTEQYRQKGVQVFSGDTAVAISRHKNGYLTRTRGGRDLTSDLIVVGVGIAPNLEIARAAQLKTDNGVIVNEFLQTSDPDIYGAGDIAFFPEANLGPRRIEHWDNALAQGKHAGGNMAGAKKPFTYMPYFFSDLFEFGYEAVGDVNSRLRTVFDWKEENKKGVIYYLDGDRLRGAMMCNIFGKVDEARALIGKGAAVRDQDLRGAIN